MAADEKIRKETMLRETNLEITGRELQHESGSPYRPTEDMHPI